MSSSSATHIRAPIVDLASNFLKGVSWWLGLQYGLLRGAYVRLRLPWMQFKMKMRVVSKVRTSGDASNRLCHVVSPPGKRRQGAADIHENDLVFGETQVGFPKRCDQVLIGCDDIGQCLGEETCSRDCYRIEIRAGVWKEQLGIKALKLTFRIFHCRPRGIVMKQSSDLRLVLTAKGNRNVIKPPAQKQEGAYYARTWFSGTPATRFLVNLATA